MTTFSIGTFTANGVDAVRGQAFAPTVPGPNGSGSPGSASQIYIRTISVGYPSSSTTGRAQKMYVYSVELTDPDEIGRGADLVAESTTGTTSDGAGLFGTGTHYRTFNFNPPACGVSGPYYFYFDRDQSAASVSDQNPYSGGNCYDLDLENMSPECLQFQATIDTA